MSEENKEKVDYSSTLNLPNTDFPMRGGLPQKEPDILKDVIDNGLYEDVLKKNEGHDHFILHDGPPYANGEIHAGHALNKVLKDTIVRYKSMQGYYSPFIPGYDTHGMPTEKKAIEKLGLDRDKIPVTEFRDTCKKFTTDYKEIQTAGFKRLGVLGDWNNPYVTYDPKMEARQIGVFGDMYKKGYIYKGLKPVYWCTDCETALAEAEIEYKDVTTPSIYVKFPLIDSKGLFDIENAFVVIWTTTPWTLPGNMGIAIGKDFEYSVVQVEDEEAKKAGKKEEKLIIATELVDKVMKVAGIEDYRTIKTFKGEEFEGAVCQHPFMQKTSPVALGTETTVNVDLETGTGCVHCAPAYGKEDYLLGQNEDWDIEVYIDNKGCQTKDVPEFGGQFYAKSNKTIPAWLAENGYLLAMEPITHSYPHCWRCKNPVIFRATDQWFASVDKFRADVIEETKKVKWHPLDWGEARMEDMIRGRNDWCISRQRTWGVPLPIYYCKDCHEPYVTEESIAKIQDIVREEGTNAWWAKDAKELMPEGAKCSKCGCTEFIKEKDIMDVWFDSGSTHQSVLVERGLDYPADLYLEGNDQYRGWFQSSLLTSVATHGKAPFKEVLCCGMVVDAQGRKMSKSLGNGVSPIDVCDKYGADILRLWALSSNYEMDVNLSDGILKGISDVYRKWRNTARFLLGNTSDYDPNEPVAYEDLEEIDRWALTRLNKLVKDVTEDYEKYDFGTAYHDINQFCVVDMSNIYLDIIKDRLYTEKADSKLRRSAQTVMYYILDALVKILTPMTVFTAEEIWSKMKHTSDEEVRSPMLTSYPKVNEAWDDQALVEKWKRILAIKDVVAKELELKRADKVIGNSLEAEVVVTASGDDYKLLNENKDLIKDVIIISKLDVVEGTDEEVTAVAKRTEMEKCERCWKYDEDIEDGLCPRCREVLGK